MATLCSVEDADARVRKAQGERLASCRKAAGYRSSRSASTDSGWPESSYRAHESGSRTIGQDDAERYAKRYRLLGVKQANAKYILFGNDSSETSSSDKEHDESQDVSGAEPLRPLYRNQMQDNDSIQVSVGAVRKEALRMLARARRSKASHDTLVDVLIATLADHSSASVVLRLKAADRTGSGSTEQERDDQ